MENAPKVEIMFAKESPDVWNSIVEDLITKIAQHIAPDGADEIKMKAIRSGVEKEITNLLEENAGVINGETVSWTKSLSLANDYDSALKNKTNALLGLLGGLGKLKEALSQKI